MPRYLITKATSGRIGELAEIVRETPRRYYIKGIGSNDWVIGASGHSDTGFYVEKKDVFEVDVNPACFGELKVAEGNYMEARRHAQRAFDEALKEAETVRDTAYADIIYKYER